MQRKVESCGCDRGRRKLWEEDITAYTACRVGGMVRREWKGRHGCFPGWEMEEWIMQAGKMGEGTAFIRGLNSTLRTARTFGRLREAHVWKE